MRATLTVTLMGVTTSDTAEVLSIGGREVHVTHPDKPYFSEHTKLAKLDLLRDYLSVAPGAPLGSGTVRWFPALRRWS